MKMSLRTPESHLPSAETPTRKRRILGRLAAVAMGVAICVGVNSAPAMAETPSKPNVITVFSDGAHPADAQRVPLAPTPAEQIPLQPHEATGMVVGTYTPGSVINVGGPTSYNGFGAASLDQNTATGAANAVEAATTYGQGKQVEFAGWSAGNGAALQGGATYAESIPQEQPVTITLNDSWTHTGGLGSELTSGPLTPLQPTLQNMGITMQGPEQAYANLPPNVHVVSNSIGDDFASTGFFNADNTLKNPVQIAEGIVDHYSLLGSTDVQDFSQAQQEGRVQQTTFTTPGGATVTENHYPGQQTVQSLINGVFGLPPV